MHRNRQSAKTKWWIILSSWKITYITTIYITVLCVPCPDLSYHLTSSIRFTLGMNANWESITFYYVIGSTEKHNSIRFTEHGQSILLLLVVFHIKIWNSATASFFNMMGLLHSCSYNAIAGINNNLSPSLEHDMRFPNVARNPAIWPSNMDSNLWTYLTSQTMVSMPEAKCIAKL